MRPCLFALMFAGAALADSAARIRVIVADRNADTVGSVTIPIAPE